MTALDRGLELDDAVVLAAVAEAGRLFPRYAAAVEAALGRGGER